MTIIGTDQQYEHAVERLAEEFDAVFTRDEVARELHAVRADMEATAKVRDFIPVLAERYAKEHLQAIAHARGASITKFPVVMFVSPRNASATQMAAVMTDKYSGGRIHVLSAGVRRAEEIAPAVIEVMHEYGIDTTTMYPRAVNRDVLDAADVVVSMADPDLGDDFTAKQHLDWDVTVDEDDIASVRAARDELKVRVDELIESLLGEGSVLSAQEAADYQSAKQAGRAETPAPITREAQPA
ncbi:low molecular weight phosphatase family protein [Kytococcus sedentarius]|uniref:arsenate-mycothiol transferase ArsC n=1 Tax=Kytococcus sedentarius TaxID=1276 RepID=UPI0035BBC253